MSTPIIEIRGDRQTGKTHAGIAVAAADCMQGRRVLIVSPTLRESTEAFRRLAALIPREQVAALRAAHGQQRIDTKAGGRIHFTSVKSCGQRGVAVDTLILDGIDSPDARADCIPSLNAADDPRIVVIERSAQ